MLESGYDIHRVRMRTRRDTLSTSGAETLRLHVHVEADETGMYVAQVRELPGCVAQGASEEVAIQRLTEVIPVYVQVALDRMRPSSVSGTSSSSGSHGGDKRDFVLALA